MAKSSTNTAKFLSSDDALGIKNYIRVMNVFGRIHIVYLRSESKKKEQERTEQQTLRKCL